MKTKLNVLLGKYCLTVLDGEDEENPPKPVVPPTGEENKTFTQEQINKILADDRRKHQTQMSKLNQELEALKSKSDLTTEERAELDSRLEQINSALLTEKEQAKRTVEKLTKKHTEELTSTTAEKEAWRNRYIDSTIQRSITDAAIASKAFNPSQIVAMLRNQTRLDEVKGEDGKPTGEFVVRAKISDKNAEGQPITLDLTVEDAVKRMSEMDGYLNLFTASGSGGAGGTTKLLPTGEVDWAKLARDNPDKYRELREKGQLPSSF